ncbi:MAG TPA: helix-turn-helix transcriptional regulator [Candidatus Limnocylindrales bacterium]|nr:helix-turn-helix transcriptional regulator [Candidatus Limnocylindrales bacterium]
MFEALGIDRSDEQIYLHLVRKGPTSIAALAAATGQGRRAARAVVARLRSRGLAQLSPHEQVIAIPIEIGVEHLIRQRRHDLEMVRQTATRLADQIRARAPAGEIVVLSGQADATAAIGSAQHELRVLARSPDWAPAFAGPRMVTYRLVCDTSAPWGHDLAQTRLAHGVPANLALADRNTALLQLEQSVLMVRPGRLLDALGALFEAIWSSATPVNSPTPSVDSLDSQDRAVLSLLVAGLTDDAVGARLGMSRRTVARRVQRLMTETGAHSRLQLGWWARERNWLV